MRLRRSSILIFTCFSCLVYPRASTATPNLAPKIIKLAQSSISTAQQTVLKPGISGPDVQALQTQLKKLGYYNRGVNGRYNTSTRMAVAKFQKAKGLKRVDGIADVTTQRSLQAALVVKNPIVTSSIIDSPIFAAPISTSQSTAKPKQTQRGLVWWLLLGLGSLGAIGAMLYLMKWVRQVRLAQNFKTLDSKTFSKADKDPVVPPLPSETTPNQHQDTSVTSSHTPPPTKLLLPDKTSRLAKVNIVDELIKDLGSHDPTKRRKAIWDLGQQGDSRAIQPLMELMVDTDSQQTSLVLAALAEIGVRTLKPMNRALAISMQDPSPQVRQNAIRDLTRIYDMVSQMSQVLRHALEDPDAEVQATARYALTQINRIRALSEQKILPEDSHQDSRQ
ncbi:peptidoglycan-binding protein [Komarekiella sp. 'clone 1']|uniref:Peptidoglycan-binding protein n=1 Tax=Komarekiella delphini-convector SJRDD-AB1 TaxID=2593771 RepID=A0AA40T3B7_9NOST|nr:peptidoglycan-binding protein [Komarekiella delphini-convector]MBD6619837.1 peptidoglycan-binding protein [Komarekiella delphini-convector SJRDD-AB1]